MSLDDVVVAELRAMRAAKKLTKKKNLKNAASKKEKSDRLESQQRMKGKDDGTVKKILRSIASRKRTASSEAAKEVAVEHAPETFPGQRLKPCTRS